MIAFCACSERMSISTDNAEPRLVITGYITTDTMVHTIRVSQTMAYFGNDQAKTFPDAIVRINDNALMSAGDGVYATDPSFHGVPGEKYKLEVYVDFDEDGTQEYYTAETVMPLKHNLDSISMHPVFSNMESDRRYWFLMVHFQDLPGPNTFGAHLYVNDYKYSNKLQRYFLNEFGDDAAEGAYIVFPVYVLREKMRWDNDEDYLLYTDDKITVELNMMSQAYYDYVRAAAMEIAGGNPLFAGPPANVPGNISGDALGIFGAYTTSRKSIYLDRKYGFPERP
jgi:hypothetical protein